VREKKKILTAHTGDALTEKITKTVLSLKHFSPADAAKINIHR